MIFFEFSVRFLLFSNFTSGISYACECTNYVYLRIFDVDRYIKRHCVRIVSNKNEENKKTQIQCIKENLNLSKTFCIYVNSTGNVKCLKLGFRCIKWHFCEQIGDMFKMTFSEAIRQKLGLQLLQNLGSVYHAKNNVSILGYEAPGILCSENM